MASMVQNTTDYIAQANAKVAANLPTINAFALPKIEKVCINIGVGKYENKEIAQIATFLEKLSGQKPKLVASKMNVAGFKLRAGKVVGVIVTLRKTKALDLILNLIHLALPRARDFKGIKKGFNANYSSYSLGIENAGIFPQVGFDNEINFGMQVNIVFKDANKNNVMLLENMKFPFINE
jgi:large subunit ribosomal protein L5